MKKVECTRGKVGPDKAGSVHATRVECGYRLVWCTRRKWSAREGRLGLGRHLKEMRSVESHQCTCTCIMLYRSLTHIYTSIYMLIQTYTHTPHTLTDRSCDVVGWIGAHNGSGVHEREGWAWVGWIGARDEREGWA